jgi:uncharacterized DUF497 family protein
VVFEWDEQKRLANLAKHGLDFLDAPAVFASPMVITPDRRRAYPEERWAALGKLRGMVVYLAYTWRGDQIRIISRRRASRKERRIYEEKIPD